MRKLKKMLVALLVVSILTVSMASVAYAAPTPTSTYNDYGYGVVITTYTFYFDNKYEALAFIDGCESPNYYQAVEYLLGAGIASLSTIAGCSIFGTAFGLILLANNMGYGAMLDNAKSGINSASSQHVTVTVNHVENARTGGYGYMSTYYSVGTW